MKATSVQSFTPQVEALLQSSNVRLSIKALEYFNFVHLQIPR